MMSKMISRRVFLKATGLAVLSAAAAGALAGCGGGGAPSTASPTMDGTRQQDMADIKINMGSFVPLKLNSTTTEGNYYKYTYLYIDNSANNDAFDLSISDFTCTVDGTPATVCSLDNIEKDNTLQFTATTSVAPGRMRNSIPLYIKLSAEQYRNDNKTVIVFTSVSKNKKATFTYEAASIYPDILIEEA